MDADAQLLVLVRDALTLMALASAPALGAALVVGFIAATFQAVTQLQDAALSAVPKLVAATAALALCAPWIGAQLTRFCVRVFEAFALVAIF